MLTLNLRWKLENGCNVEIETCSSASSTIDTERKCEDSMKEKDESSSGQCGSVHSTPSSNSVSWIANRLSYYSWTRSTLACIIILDTNNAWCVFLFHATSFYCKHAYVDG